MAEKSKDTNKISSLTLGLIVGAVVLVAAFAFGLLYPKYRHIQEVKKDWVSKTIRLEEQKLFYPIYVKAQVLANESFENMLPFPERKAISRDQIASLSEIFKDIAENQDMVLSENRLDTASFDIGADQLSLDLTFNGKFLNFRPCLISLAQLPCFKSFENIEIRTDQKSIRHCVVRFKIAIENNNSSGNNQG